MAGFMVGGVEVQGVRYADGREIEEGTEIKEVDAAMGRVVLVNRNALGVIVDRRTLTLNMAADGWLEI